MLLCELTTIDEQLAVDLTLVDARAGKGRIVRGETVRGATHGEVDEKLPAATRRILAAVPAPPTRGLISRGMIAAGLLGAGAGGLFRAADEERGHRLAKRDDPGGLEQRPRERRDQPDTRERGAARRRRAGGGRHRAAGGDRPVVISRALPRRPFLIQG